MNTKRLIPVTAVLLPLIGLGAWAFAQSAGQSQQNRDTPANRAGAADRSSTGAGANNAAGVERDRAGAGQTGIDATRKAKVGREVTLTGRIMDVHTFFVAGGAQDQILQGSPISPERNTPGAGNSAGRSATARNPAGDNSRNQPSAGSAGASAGNTSGQGSGAADAAGRSSAAGTAGTGSTGNTPDHSPGHNAGAMTGSRHAQVLILQTSSGPVLISQETAIATGASRLQPSSEEIQVRGRLFERSGLRFLLVSSADQSGPRPVAPGTGDRPGDRSGSDTGTGTDNRSGAGSGGQESGSGAGTGTGSSNR